MDRLREVTLRLSMLALDPPTLHGGNRNTNHDIDVRPLKEHHVPLTICVDGLHADFEGGFVASNIREAGSADVGYRLMSCAPCLMAIHLGGLIPTKHAERAHLRGHLVSMFRDVCQPDSRHLFLREEYDAYDYMTMPGAGDLKEWVARTHQGHTAFCPDLAAKVTLAAKYLVFIKVRHHKPQWLADLDRDASVRGCKLMAGHIRGSGGIVQIVGDSLQDLQGLLASINQKHARRKLRGRCMQLDTVVPGLTMTRMKTEELECTTCYRTSEDTRMVQMNDCKHVACVDCFKSWCKIDRQSKFPLICPETGCKCHIPLPHLIANLDGDELRDIAKQALTVATAQESGDDGRWSHCTHPDCGRPYPRTRSVDGEGQQHLCTGCLTTTCTECGGDYHSGETCAANRTHVSSDANMTAWMKATGARACIKCSTPIEKVSGCNHVECSGCHVHICWQCMNSFGTAPECYGHMAEVHRSYVD